MGHITINTTRRVAAVHPETSVFLKSVLIDVRAVALFGVYAILVQ